MAVWTKSQAKEQVLEWKSAGHAVVFTNGCFDLLHRGHIDYLTKAKALGTKLIIGLNSDASVFILKGEGRPVQLENDRAVIIDALQVVDGVIIFSEGTPLELIKELKPDILVKGGDYTENSVVGADEVRNNGGSVKILPFKKGCGTTLLIKRIQGAGK
ncbi:MAG TPA: D-glycero-beta-D-manno-heptose 1-phosphate adenylyltransferase [Candidatus Marinimicrobia bacterium]|nr:D-glycero-beta-D-manno-heptose 1-phosphate adenylyltransferase [Candidatus Neomarinimicrobiota bacterium]